MSVASSSQNPMWANAMREVLAMVEGRTDEEEALAVRQEAEAKLTIFLGWLDGSLSRPTDEQRQRMVREVTALYRRAKVVAGIGDTPSRRMPPPAAPVQAPAPAPRGRYDDELSDESTERLIDPEARRRKRRSSASGE